MRLQYTNLNSQQRSPIVLMPPAKFRKKKDRNIFTKPPKKNCSTYLRLWEATKQASERAFGRESAYMTDGNAQKHYTIILEEPKPRMVMLRLAPKARDKGAGKGDLSHYTIA